MFSDLAFIDWIALIFAAILLAAAAAAAIVAYATAKNRPTKLQPSPAVPHRPAHAAGPTPPLRATKTVGRATLGPSISRPVSESKPVLTVVPDPPVLVSASSTNGARLSSNGENHHQPSSNEQSVAARAARLRKRPVPEHGSRGRKRIVSAVQPKRTPASAPSLGVDDDLPDSGRLSIDMDSTEGFAPRNPGFFDDPVGRHDLRYWDGYRWTEYVKEHGARFIDPL